LTCVEETGAGKVSVSEGADGADGRETRVAISGGGSGMVVKAHGAAEVERRVVDRMRSDRATAWAGGNMAVCLRAAREIAGVRRAARAAPTSGFSSSNEAAKPEQEAPKPAAVPAPGPVAPVVQQFFDLRPLDPPPFVPPPLAPELQPPAPRAPCLACPPPPILTAPVALASVAMLPLTLAVIEHARWQSRAAAFDANPFCNAAATGRGGLVCQQLYDDGTAARSLAITGYVTAGLLLGTAAAVWLVERHRIACAVGGRRAGCAVAF
jgi:hypothetical protein